MLDNQLAYTTPFPMGIEVASADGIYLFDSNGYKYTDLISGIAVCNAIAYAAKNLNMKTCL